MPRTSILLQPAYSPLSKIGILLADADRPLANILRSMLKRMGFGQVRLAHDGTEALAALKAGDIDLIITDWQMAPMDGLSLLKHLRQDADSPNRMLPVIMLTARSDQPDVELARDMGVNEYLLRPFTAKTIFERIMKTVEQPRRFVMAEHYVGPDRRHVAHLAPELKDRRNAKPQLVKKEYIAPGMPPEGTRIILPDFALKQKISATKSIASLVTPEILEASQQEITAASDEFLQRLREDTRLLEQMYVKLRDGPAKEETLQWIADSALVVKSRASVFGYSRAAQIADSVRHFCRELYELENPGHLLILEKHIESLSAIFAADIKGDGGSAGMELVRNLQTLAKKYLGPGGGQPDGHEAAA